MSMDLALDYAKCWMSTKDAQDALVKRWQALEHSLSLRTKLLEMDLEEAMSSDLYEARAMRGLISRIEAHDRSLNRQTKRLAGQRALSPAGTLAKVEVALRMTCPIACGEDVWALVLSAAHDLREMALDTPSIDRCAKG